MGNPKIVRGDAANRPPVRPKEPHRPEGPDPGGLALDGAGLGRLRTALLAWYRTCRRPLPWRLEPSLYRTVVSEFMCQQTQIATVLPYFGRWMAELPDFAALAAAPEARVLRLWEGLGYYSRARNLHRLAQAVTAAPGGPPRTAAAWLELPGVGPYTAAAVASIAFGEPVACVDGNVVRILARLTADSTGYPDGVSAARAHAPLAGRLVNPEHPGDHNQAMMELGARVCGKASPDCPACPLRPWCAAAQSGDPSAYPRIERRALEKRSVTRVWCERAGALLLHQAPAGARRLANLHELPTAEQAGLAPGKAQAGALLLKRTRGITHHLIEETIRRAPAPRGLLAPGLAWIPLSDLETITLSGPHRRWVREILAGMDRG